MTNPGESVDLVDRALDAAFSGGQARSVSSSDLSVDEAILLGEVGFEPRRLVMGSAIFHVGYAFQSNTAEITQLSTAMSSAREAALHRLTAEGSRAGGDGVVGVRLEIGSFEGHALEFTAIGTAIAETGSRRRRNETDFFTSSLSGQDFYLLRRAGWTPLGLVMGSCVMQIGWRASSSAMRGGNRELPEHTRAMYDARELAMERVQREALQLRATGVVGMSVVQRSHAWGTRAIELFALGTAVREMPGGHQALQAEPVVTMDDLVVATDPAVLRAARE